MKCLKFVFFVFTILLFNEIAISQDKVIIWSNDKEIQWSDFHGNKDSVGFFGAGIATDILFSYTENENGQCTFDLCAVMHPNLSFSTIRTDNLLIHERTHFDICEFVVRIYRKKISKLIVSETTSKCDSIFTKYDHDMRNELYEIDRKYDLETDHGRNKLQQEEWAQKVKKWLEELNEYAEPVSE